MKILNKIYKPNSRNKISTIMADQVQVPPILNRLDNLHTIIILNN